MEIQIIQTKTNVTDELESIKSFGILLNKTVSEIKMIHWFITNHNAHVILGDLYDDLSDLFDELQEEIIGTSKLQISIGCNFPNFQSDLNIETWDKFEFYENDDQTLINSFYTLSSSVKLLLTCMELKSYIESVKSGLVNTIDSIVTRLNKAEYLLTMVKI